MCYRDAEAAVTSFGVGMPFTRHTTGGDTRLVSLHFATVSAIGFGIITAGEDNAHVGQDLLDEF